MIYNVPQIFYDSALESNYNALSAMTYLIRFYGCISIDEVIPKLRSLLAEVNKQRESSTDNIEKASLMILQNKIYYYTQLAEKYSETNISDILLSSSNNEVKLLNLKSKYKMLSKAAVKDYLSKMVIHLDSTTADQLDIYTATLAKDTLSRLIKDIIKFR